MAVKGLIVRALGGFDTYRLITRGLSSASSDGSFNPLLQLLRKIPMQIVIDGRGRLHAIDYEAVTVDDTVRALNATKLATAWGARIILESGPIRYLLHGANPSASVGVPFANGQEIIVLGDDMKDLRMIRSGATSGTAHVIYLQNDAQPM